MKFTLKDIKTDTVEDGSGVTTVAITHEPSGEKVSRSVTNRSIALISIVLVRELSKIVKEIGNGTT